MSNRLHKYDCSPLLVLGLIFGLTVTSISLGKAGSPGADGIVKVKSIYPFEETIHRLKNDISSKGIKFFISLDQAKLAADAGISLRPSTLLIFGNPPLGTLFITAKPEAGLDWPVRLLVTQDQDGTVWAIYTDFHHIARRHQIVNRDAEFTKASEVIGSITSSISGN